MKRKWRTSEIVIIAVVAAPFLFLAWSAWQSTLYDAAMQQKVKSSFESVPCEIKSSSWTTVQTKQNGAGQTSSMFISGYDVHAEFSYSVDGQPYLSRRIKPRYQYLRTQAEAEAFVARYPVRQAQSCYYDPANPSMAFLEQ